MHQADMVTCLEASVQQINGCGRPFFVDHELEAETDAMTAKDCEYVRGEPVVPSLKLAAALLLIHSLRVSSKSRQPSLEGK